MREIKKISLKSNLNAYEMNNFVNFCDLMKETGKQLQNYV